MGKPQLTKICILTTGLGIGILLVIWQLGVLSSAQAGDLNEQQDAASLKPSITFSQAPDRVIPPASLTPTDSSRHPASGSSPAASELSSSASADTSASGKSLGQDPDQREETQAASENTAPSEGAEPAELALTGPKRTILTLLLSAGLIVAGVEIKILRIRMLVAK